MRSFTLFIAAAALFISITAAKPPGTKDIPPSLPCKYGDRCWLNTGD